MRIVFDQGTPVPLAIFLDGHEIQTAHELGWSNLENGELINEAESQFDVLVTTDKNLRYQQNLSDRKLAVFVLPTTRWPDLLPHGAVIATAISSLQPNDYIEWELPD